MMRDPMTHIEAYMAALCDFRAALKEAVASGRHFHVPDPADADWLDTVMQRRILYRAASGQFGPQGVVEAAALGKVQ